MWQAGRPAQIPSVPERARVFLSGNQRRQRRQAHSRYLSNPCHLIHVRSNISPVFAKSAKHNSRRKRGRGVEKSGRMEAFGIFRYVVVKTSLKITKAVKKAFGNKLKL